MSEEVAQLRARIHQLANDLTAARAARDEAEAKAAVLRAIVADAIGFAWSQHPRECANPKSPADVFQRAHAALADDAGQALLAELAAARALAARLNDRKHWTAGICPCCGFGRKLDGAEFHGTGCVLAAYNEAKMTSGAAQRRSRKETGARMR